MRAGLLLPLLLLVCLAVGWAMALLSSRRRRQLTGRVAAAVPGGAVAPANTALPSIRLRQREASRMRRVARLLRVPLDIPRANLIPPAWIFLFATAGAAISGWMGHFLLSMPMVALDGIITGIVLVRGLFGWEIRRYQGKLVRQLPDAVQLVVSATRAGLPVSEAFRAIAQEMPSPTRDEFIQVEREMALGTSADAALLALHRRTGVTEYAIFAVTIGVQARSGGRLAETIQNLADTVRERLAIGGKARALAGEAKVSAIIMIVLPIIVALLQSIMAPQQMALLFTEPRGLRLFAIGLITLITGSLTMQFMIRGATRD